MQPPASTPSPLWASFFPGKQGKRCNQPARPPRGGHGDTLSARKTEASGSPTEACRLESTEAATEKKHSSQHTHTSAACPWWSPRTPTPPAQTMRPLSGVTRAHRPPRNAGLGPPPPPTPHNHRQPGEGTRAPLSLCEHPSRKEGHLGAGDNLGVPRYGCGVPRLGSL